MGKTEKIVVLSILFLVVVLFVWSMGGDSTDAAERGSSGNSQVARYSGEETPGKTPLKTPGIGAAGNSGALPSGGSVQTQEGALLTRPNTGSGIDGGAGPEGAERIELERVPGSASNLLHAGIERDSSIGSVGARRPGSTSRQASSVHMRPGWDIVTTDGLEATLNPEMLLYRPKEDATWETLAVDLYGDASKAVLLRHNNESMDAPGEIIFVPAKDDGAAEVQARVVEVLKGETLWQVSKRTLGRGSRWRELFEANRDVISDPDYLSPGTILTVPAR